MPRVIVVGGGAGGVPLAARLSEEPLWEVVLIEAGPARDLPAELDDGTTIRAALPEHPANWGHFAHLTLEHPYLVARGRVIGGSSAINGGAWVRARPHEFDAWAERGGAAWSYERLLPAMRRMETDLDLGATVLHGGDGPMRVRRPPQDTPLTRAFTEAAVELGYPREPDKNAPGPAGVGPVPSTVRDGRRYSTASAYLPATSGRPNLQILGDSLTRRVLFDGRRAVGVETNAGVITGDEVVLCAGGIGTAHLLLVSGVGPRRQLEALGIPVVADLPVGTAFSDHPDVTVTWRAHGAVDEADGTPFPTTLDLASGVGPATPGATDIEIVLATRPLTRLLGIDGGTDAGTATELPLIVSLQAPTSRGTIRLASADPAQPPVIDYGYLASAQDRARLREGVRTAVRLLHTAAFAGLFVGLVDLDRPTLDNDASLDTWIRAHLGTAIHLSGSAPLGAVVGGDARVIGVQGLRVADTSILPTVPTRGPYATAVLIGEHVAGLLRTHG